MCEYEKMKNFIKIRRQQVFQDTKEFSKKNVFLTCSMLDRNSKKKTEKTLNLVYFANFVCVCEEE